MGDLHCPATLLIARHGEAEYDLPDVPANRGGRLTEAGRAQVRALAASVAHRKVARVFTSTREEAVESGAVAAGILDVDAVSVDGLEELTVGELAGRPEDGGQLASVLGAWAAGDLAPSVPAAEPGTELVARYREALQSIADQFRGETVLVVSHGGVMALALPRIARTPRDGVRTLAYPPHCAAVEVSVNGDGFEVLRWPGAAPAPG